jgi:hypothetical protein
LVIGAERAGTTWIHAYLAARGDIGLPFGWKETRFFNERYDRGLDWYSQQFRIPTPNHGIVEVEPTYHRSLEAPKRILRDLGLVKLVCSFREPAARTFSHYLAWRNRGLVTCSFREAVVKYPELLDGSRYATHWKRWVAIFGRENIHPLFQETLATDVNQYAAQLCQHLDLPFHVVPPTMTGKVNAIQSLPSCSLLARLAHQASGAAHAMGLHTVVRLAIKLGLKSLCFGRPGSCKLPKLSAEDALWVASELEPEVEELEEMLQVPLTHWKPAAFKRSAA